MSNYPPGVTGSEYEIAGPDYERDSDQPCRTCGSPTVEQGYRGQRWLVCDDNHIEDLESEPDPPWDTIEERQEWLGR